MGGNDVRTLVPDDAAFVAQAQASAILAAAVAELVAQVEQLIATGATNLVVTGVPDVGMIPEYDLNGDGVLAGEELARSEQATAYSQQLDALIQEQLAQLQAAHPQADINYVSMTAATEENLAYLEALFGRPIDPTAEASGAALGDDLYRVRTSSAVILERAGEWFDTLVTSVSYKLAAGVSIESLKANSFGGTADIDLTGNALAQQIRGNAGDNLIDGKGGKDVLTGGDGAHSFSFTTSLRGNVDTITDFDVSDDTIVLDNAIFGGLAGGNLAPGAFKIGTAATDASDRIIYDPETGNLYFDRDGNGDAAQVQFATIDAGLSLSSGDFFVI